MDNAFLPIWNHKWFQCLTRPLPSIPSTSTPQASLRARHLAFYRSWIAFVRAHNGDVVLAYTPTPTHSTPSSDPPTPPNPFITSPSNEIAAVAVLLPPHARPLWFEPVTAWRTRLLQSLYRLAGLRGLWRTSVTFEGNVRRMIAKCLEEINVAGGKEQLLGFC